MFLLGLLVFSLVGLISYLINTKKAINAMPQITPSKCILPNNNLDSLKNPLISVIVPAYNEVDNIEDCVISILDSTNMSKQELQVLVVDDQSTDKTLEILQTIQTKIRDKRLCIISGAPRPKDKIWMGKNWACAQAVEQAQGEYLLFLDADVRLKPGAIESILNLALADNISLLNCIPEMVCKSCIEYVIQPLIFINLMISLNSKEVKNPKKKTAFAGGFFLLFKRSAYETIGGHHAVASKVAEDVALARLIKHHQLKLSYRLAVNIASLRMYRSWSALWEGWTKVLYVGAQRNFGLMLLLASVMLSIYSIPWISLMIIMSQSFTEGWPIINLLTICLALTTIFFHLTTIFFQYKLRVLSDKALACSLKYWWLSGVGGLLIAIMAIASVIKTETGWGWTWRGRSLKT
jgi:glycosyltransferase involved in cell wall biosynthesis